MPFMFSFPGDQKSIVPCSGERCVVEDLSAGLVLLSVRTDGEELLRLTMRFKVHISLKPEPLSLRAEGVRSALRALEKELTKIKEVRNLALSSYLLLY